jgi:hypothetical protein
MRGSIKALLVCGALIAAGLAAAAPAAASSAASSAAGPAASASDSCTHVVENIHWGTINGQASVTFAGQVECNFSAPTILLHTSLFFCGSQQPENNKGWLLADCQNMTNNQTYAPEESGVTYTLSSPASTEVATKAGYYAAILSFTTDNTSSGPLFGTPAHCSSGSKANTCTNVAPA